MKRLFFINSIEYTENKINKKKIWKNHILSNLTKDQYSRFIEILKNEILKWEDENLSFFLKIMWEVFIPISHYIKIEKSKDWIINMSYDWWSILWKRFYSKSLKKVILNN